MTPEEKKPYEEQSVKHSEQLLEKHPDYRYRYLSTGNSPPHLVDTKRVFCTCEIVYCETGVCALCSHTVCRSVASHHFFAYIKLACL